MKIYLIVLLLIGLYSYTNSLSTEETTLLNFKHKYIEKIISLTDFKYKFEVVASRNNNGFKLIAKDEIKENDNFIFVDKRYIFSSCTIFPFQDKISKALIVFLEMEHDQDLLLKNNFLHSYFHSVLWSYQMLFLKYSSSITEEDYLNQKEDKLIVNSIVSKEMSILEDKEFVDFAIAHSQFLYSGVGMDHKENHLANHLKVNNKLYETLFKFHDFLLGYLEEAKLTDLRYKSFINSNTKIEFNLLLIFIFNENFEVKMKYFNDFLTKEDKKIYTDYLDSIDSQRKIFSSCIISSPLITLISKKPAIANHDEEYLNKNVGIHLNPSGISMFNGSKINIDSQLFMYSSTYIDSEEAFFKGDFDLLDYYAAFSNNFYIELEIMDMSNNKDIIPKLSNLFDNKASVKFPFLKNQINNSLLNALRISFINPSQLNEYALNYLSLKKDRITIENETMAVLKYISILNKIKSSSLISGITSDLMIIIKLLDENNKASLDLQQTVSLSNIKRTKNILLLGLLREKIISNHKRLSLEKFKNSILKENIQILKKSIIN